MSEDLPKQPAGRQHFKIAIICAMTLEADMVEMILDKDWADDNVRYGKAPGDTNAYTAGVIAHHNVILAYCPTIGSNSAAQVATSLSMSFTGIKIAFVVGVCGVSPYTMDHEEIVLGDCIVSTAVVQFDLGRRGPKSFRMKDGLDGLGRVGTEIGCSLTKLMTRKSRLRLSRNLHSHLETLKEQDLERVKYPGHKEDRLYIASYTHCHRAIDGTSIVGEICTSCDDVIGICGKSCAALQCGDEYLVSRDRLVSDAKPSIHFGHFGSSNTVLKSGLEREMIVDANKVIAFEMEGSGVWDICPTIVVKAACDYADSHKNKKWQPYAAAVAASALKSLLQELELADEELPLKDSNTKRDVEHSSDSGIVISSSLNYGFQGHSGVVNIHNYQQSVVSQRAGFDNDAPNNLIQRADAAIRKYYNSGSNLKIVRLSGEELGLNECYINLALVNRADQKQTRETFSLRERLIRERSDAGELVTLEALFRPRKSSNGSIISPRRIFIQGRAGVGKTTLCKKLVHEFLQGRLEQNSFDRLLWIPLRRLRNNKSKDYNWQEVIQDVYSLQDPTWKNNREAYSEQLYDSAFLGRTLLLFDGLDEVSREWKDGSNIREFLGSIICDSPNVIITSRPHVKALSIGQFDLELETVGFLPDQIDTYLRNCAIPEAIPKMKSFIAARPLIQGLLRIPIQLDAFCCTWKHEEDSQQDNVSGLAVQSSKGDHTSTMTQLYWSISFELCRKDMVRLAALHRACKVEESKFSQFSEEMLKTFGDFEVEQHLERELRFLRELAFQGMVNNIIEFSPKYQNQIVSYLSKERSKGRLQLPAPYNSILEALSFLRSSDIERDASKRNYHFLHLTFQEFFAAQHFVEHWQEKTPLWLMLSSKPQELSPLKFLQKEKYNPRYNIFWRFVTGLIQIQPDEATKDKHNNQQDIVTFFHQLHNKPIDLIGLTHRRLLMYCLSEVVPDGRQRVQELREREEKFLYREMVKEYELSNSCRLGSEAEFPENIFCFILQNATSLPQDVVLKALDARPFVSTQTLHIVSNFMTDKSTIQLQLQAVRILLKNSKAISQELVERAMQICVISLKNMDPGVRCFAIEGLGLSTSLSQDAATALITMLHHELEYNVLNSAIDTLDKQSFQSQESINNLAITILRHKSSIVRDWALGQLSKHLPLTQKAIDILITMLEDEDFHMRSFAVGALGMYASLPQEAINIPITMLKDDDYKVQIAGLTALEKQLFLPRETITVLVSMLQQQHPQVRYEAVHVLGRRFLSQSLSHQNIIDILKDEDNGIQSSAISALIEMSPLPSLAPEVIAALFAMLSNSNSHIRSLAIEILGERSTSLPQEAVTALIAMLEDDDWRVQWFTTTVLREQSAPSLTKEAINVLIMIAGRCDWELQSLIVDTLCKQVACLPQEAVNTLVAMLEDEEMQDFAVNVLEAQSPLEFLDQEAITILIGILEDLEFMSRHQVVSILCKHLSLLQPSIRQQIIADVAAILETLPQFVYEYLDCHGFFYTDIKDLQDVTWQQIWSHWLNDGFDNEITCYKLDGNLNVWSNGVLHQISTNPIRTKEMLQVVLNKKSN